MTLITKNADGGVTIDITKIRQPDNLDEKVWRYINLPKLIAFLRMETLCFIQASELKDQHEGTLTGKEIRARDELIQVAKRAAKTIPAENDTYTAAVGQVGQISESPQMSVGRGGANSMPPQHRNSIAVSAPAE